MHFVDGIFKDLNKYFCITDLHCILIQLDYKTTQFPEFKKVSISKHR